MANRPKGYGLSSELERKKAAKFSADSANEVINWIKKVLENGDAESVELAKRLVPVTTEKEVAEQLKNGVVLCHLINIIKPGIVKKINKNNMAFKQMENIGNFLSGCESIECKSSDMFQTVDLYEANNIPQVINGIYALGRRAQKVYNGPKLGNAEVDANKRTFTDEQLRAGNSIIGLQAGSNKGASQAGQNFGKSRSIID